MKKFKKILLIFFVVLLVVLVGGVIALRIAFPPAKVKAILIARISEALDREVKIDSISFGLRGLKVKGLRISERPSFDQGIFVEAGEFLIKPNLAPLLKRQISIGEIRLISPKIAVVRRGDGSFNFGDLVVKKAVEAKREEVQPKKEEKVEKVPPEKAKPIAFSFLVSKASISKGTVKFTDKTPHKLSADLKNINMSIYNISLVTPFFVEASFDVVKENVEASLAFKGSVDIKGENIKIKETLLSMAGVGIVATGDVENFREPKKLSFSFNIESKDFVLEKLSKVFPFSGNILMAGEPEIGVEVAGNLKRINVRGNIGLKNVQMLYRDLFHKASGIEGGIAIAALLEDSNLLKLDSLSVVIGGIKASTSGNVSGLNKKDKTLNLKVALEKFDMKSLQDLVPIGKDYGLSGMVGGEIEISGAPRSLNISGKVGAQNVESVPKEMALKLDRGDLNYSGNLVDFKKPRVNFNLDIGTLEAKILQKPEKPQEGKPGPEKAKEKPQAVLEKPLPELAIPPEISVSGSVKVKKLTFQNYQISNLSAKMKLAKSVLDLSLLSLSAYNGSLKGSLGADFTKPSLEKLKFNLNSDLKNLDIYKFIQSLGRELKGEFRAIASGKMSISGEGRDLSKLNGTGLIGIKNVKIKGIKILDRVASASNIPELKEINFKSVSGKLNIKQGKVYMENAKTQGGDKLDAYCSGNVNLVRKRQDIEGKIKFTKQYSGKELAKYVGDAEGRVTVPFKIGGTFEDPKVNLDWGKLAKKAAGKAAEDVLKKEVEKGLKKLFKK